MAREACAAINRGDAEWLIEHEITEPSRAPPEPWGLAWLPRLDRIVTDGRAASDFPVGSGVSRDPNHYGYLLNRSIAALNRRLEVDAGRGALPRLRIGGFPAGH
jgi:hypothetical protein